MPTFNIYKNRIAYLMSWWTLQNLQISGYFWYNHSCWWLKNSIQIAYKKECKEITFPLENNIHFRIYFLLWYHLHNNSSFIIHLIALPHSVPLLINIAFSLMPLILILTTNWKRLKEMQKLIVFPLLFLIYEFFYSYLRFSQSMYIEFFFYSFH